MGAGVTGLQRSGQQALQGVDAHEAHARRGCVPSPEAKGTLRRTLYAGCAAREQAAPHRPQVWDSGC